MVLRFTTALAFVVLLASGCYERKCGPYQKLKDKYCVCVDGYMLNDDLDCVKTPTKSSSADAGGATASSDAGMTQDDAAMMSTSSDGCDKTTGLGCSCKGDEDCANYKADYCVIPDPSDPEMKRACLFQGCDQPGAECPSGMNCCKFPFAPKGTVCLPTEIMCPFG